MDRPLPVGDTLTAVVVTTGTPAAGVYRTVLGSAFDALHPHVRQAHLAPLHAEGEMDVVHGSHRLTRLFVGLMHLPAVGSAKPVTLRVTEEVDRAGRMEMLWIREFGASRLVTRQSARRGLLMERHGAGSLTYSLRAQDGSLVYEQKSMRVFNVRLWPGMTPIVSARASAAANGWDVEVVVRWRGHLICRYAGRMCLVRNTA
jgi:hypothetical protein